MGSARFPPWPGQERIGFGAAFLRTGLKTIWSFWYGVLGDGGDHIPVNASHARKGTFYTGINARNSYSIIALPWMSA